MSLGYWNFTEIITCLGTLNIQKDDPCWPAPFSQAACKQTNVENQITPISLHFADGQYAAFNVNKMHISKNNILFTIKSTQTTHNSKITSQKKW